MRRLLLAILIAAVMAAGAASAQQPMFPLRATASTAPPPTTNPPALSQDNLTFLGSFNIPNTVNGVGTNSAPGTLAIRYVGGVLHFISTTNTDDLVYEVTYPGISTTSPPTAALYAYWGDVYQNKRCNILTGHGPSCVNGTNVGNSTYGVFWDPVDSRLYWTFGNGYAGDSSTPAIGYSTLDDNSINPTTKVGTGTGVGSWRFAPTPPYGKALRSGMLAVPQWFQDKYTPGKRLGAGFGGAYTVGGTASFGPDVMVFDPTQMDATVPVTAAGPAGGFAPDLPLVVYGPVSATTTSNPALGHRNNRYLAGGCCDPSGSIGWWQQCDTTEGGAWVDVPATSPAHPGVSGVLVNQHSCQGNMGYFLAQFKSDHYESWLLMHSPTVLGEGIGTRLDQLYPTDMWRSLTGGTTGGLAYDPVTQRLFVLALYGHVTGGIGYPSVYVYQVADTVTPTAPVIYGNPGNATVATGSSLVATFGVSGDGKPTPTVAWQTSHDSITWTDYVSDPLNQPGAFGPQLFYAPQSNADNGLKIRAVLTNSQGSATSTSATLTMTGSAPRLAAFTTQPADQDVAAGSTVTFSAVTNGIPTVQEYIWWTSPGNVTWGDINCSTTCPGSGTNNVSYHFTTTIGQNNLYVKVCAWQPGLSIRNISRTSTPTPGSDCSTAAHLTVH